MQSRARAFCYYYNYYYHYYAAFNAPCVRHRDDESQAHEWIVYEVGDICSPVCNFFCVRTVHKTSV